MFIMYIALQDRPTVFDPSTGRNMDRTKANRSLGRKPGKKITQRKSLKENQRKLMEAVIALCGAGWNGSVGYGARR